MNLATRSDIKPRVSYAKKIAKDYERMRDLMDLIDMSHGSFRDTETIEKYKINYDLFNGRLDVSLYDDPICFNIDKKKVKFSFNTITHYPLISQVANAMYGEMIARPFKPMAKDIGTTSQTLRNKKWNELLKEMLQADVINPIRGEVTRQFMQQGNPQEILQMTPEQLQELEAKIDQQVAAKTPEDILEFMDNDFKTPTLRQAQRLLDYFVAHLDLNYVQQEGFKHAIITGQECYYIGDRHGEPVMELCNPMYLTWGGSKNTEWIQDASWVKYENWLTLEDAQQKYAEELSSSDLKKLEGFLELIPHRAKADDWKRDPLQLRVMHEMSTDDGMRIRQAHGDPNYKTKKGSNQMKEIYAAVAQKYGMADAPYSIFGVREVHFAWIDKRKVYKVTRPFQGREKIYYEDEFYEPKPDDIEVVEVWVDWAWEGTKLGTNGIDDIYVKIRPVPAQYPSLYNPYGVKLPYVGKAYNTHMNNSKNVAVIDLGKPWQKEFDTMMAQVKHDMATDFGTKFMMSLSMKPDSMDWQEWFDVMRNGNLILTDFDKRGAYNIDPNMNRSVQMSKTSDIAAKFQFMQGFRQELVRAMNFNDYRIGNISQYATNQNTQQGQAASYNQTEGCFETHRKIVEKALNMFMNRAKFIYRHNEKLKFILDDIARTELEISPEFWYEEWAIEFTTSSEEIRKVQELRQNMLTFVQNGLSMEGVLALSLANTPTDIIDIMKKEQRRIDNQRKEEMLAQQQQLQMEIDAQLKDKDQDRQFKYKMQQDLLRSQESRTDVQSKQFLYQADANRDGEADVLEKTAMEVKAKDVFDIRKTLLEKQRLALDAKKHSDTIKLGEKELKVKDKQVTNQAKAKKTSK